MCVALAPPSPCPGAATFEEAGRDWAQRKQGTPPLDCGSMGWDGMVLERAVVMRVRETPGFCPSSVQQGMFDSVFPDQPRAGPREHQESSWELRSSCSGPVALTGTSQRVAG